MQKQRMLRILGGYPNSRNVVSHFAFIAIFYVKVNVGGGQARPQYIHAKRLDLDDCLHNFAVVGLAYYYWCLRGLVLVLLVSLFGHSYH